eukprot:scaffold181260_cov45-Prasinocladus_malaysianus.AAC.1
MLEFVCADGYTGEPTFDRYVTDRKHTLFFLGHEDRHEVPGSKNSTMRAQLREQRKLVRPVVVDDIQEGYGPNILADTAPAEGSLPHPRPTCNFQKGWPTTACNSPGLDASKTSRLLHDSLFSIHVRGDDASSSRVYEAITSGTPQLFLASRYYIDVAPFKCTVQYDKMFVWLDEELFTQDPKLCIQHVMERLTQVAG